MLNRNDILKTNDAQKSIRIFQSLISEGKFETALELLKSDEAIRMNASADNNRALISVIYFSDKVRYFSLDRKKPIPIVILHNLISELLKIDSVRANAAVQNNKALGWAIKNNLTELVTDLLKIDAVKANVAVRDNEALGWAIKNNLTELVTDLLKIDAVKANVAVRDNEAFGWAIDNNHTKQAQKLIQMDAVKTKMTAMLNEAFCSAAEKGKIKKVQELLEIKDNTDNPALMLFKMAGIQLDPTADNNRALRKAAENGHIKIVQTLLKIDEVRANAAILENQALMLAAEKGHVAVVHALLKIDEVRANAAAKDNLALLLATKNGCYEIALLLLKINAVRTNAATQNNKALSTTLWYRKANTGGQKSFIENVLCELLKIDAVRNHRALLLAIDFDQFDIVLDLLKTNIIKSNTATENSDLLDMSVNRALQWRNTKILSELLRIDAIADLAAKNNKALRIAIKYQPQPSIELYQELLKNDAIKINTAAQDNEILHLAIEKNYVQLVGELLKIDAVRANAAADNNQALRLAAKKNHTQLMEILLRVPTVINSLLENNALTLVKFFKKMKKPETISKCLNALVIYGIPLAKIIDQNSGTFLQDIQSYCQAPEAYLENYSLNQKQALRILKSEQDLSSYEQALREEMQGLEQVEHADDAKKVARVMRHFNQVVKPAFIQRFENTDHTLEENLHIIEIKIRAELLNRMKVNAIKRLERFKEDKKELEINHENDLIAFIEQNFNELAAGQHESLMAEGRDFYFNSNTEDEQLAWRAYDKWAPCIEWQNLLTPPFVNKEEYSIAEMHKGKLDTNSASSIARELMCYSYLVATDEEGGEEQQRLRLGLLVGAIGDARRAHNESANDNLPDNPSCLPGIAGRMETIMASHSLKLQKEATELLPDILKTKVINAFAEVLTKLDQEQQESLYYALVMLRQETATDVLAGKGDFCEEPNWPKERQDFVNSLGTAYELMNYVNDELAKMDLDLKLHPQEIVYLLRLLADIGGGWIAPALTDAYQKSQMVELIEEDIEMEKLNKSFNVLSFSSLGKQSNDNQENESNDSEEEPNSKRHKY